MNHRRRILHLISRLDGYGGARLLRYLAASQARSGHQVLVAALAAADFVARELRDAGVTVQVVGRRWAVDPVAIARFSLLRRKARADVVHAWDAAALLYAGVAGGAGRQPPLLVTLDERETRRPWASRINRSSGRRVSTFIAADEATEAWLRSQAIAARTIEHIRPGVPRNAVPSGSRAERFASLLLPANAQVIAVAGPLARTSDLDEAIWAFELVRVIYQNARLIIFGDGPDRARLESFADSVSDPGCVQFLGYRPDMADLLPHADVFWQLDKSQATPWALLESAAAGLPAVASDTPAHRAAITDGRTGLLVPHGHRAEVARATDELFANPDRAGRLGAAAAEHIAQHWSLDASLASYERLYEQSSPAFKAST